MMNSFYYFLWATYLLGACGTQYFCWRVLKRVKPRFLRDLLVGMAFILLFTPWFVTAEGVALAPALIIFIHELAFSEGEQRLRSLVPIAAGFLLFVLILTLCYWIVGQKRLHSSSGKGSDQPGHNHQ